MIANFVDFASSRDDDDDMCDSSTKTEDFMVVKLYSKFNLITNSSLKKKIPNSIKTLRLTSIII